MYRDNQKLVIYKLMSNLYLIHMVSKVIIIKNFSIDGILIMYRTHPKLVIGKQRSNIIDSCHIQAIKFQQNNIIKGGRE